MVGHGHGDRINVVETLDFGETFVVGAVFFLQLQEIVDGIIDEVVQMVLHFVHVEFDFRGIGELVVNSLIINVVVPIRFAYARFTGDDQMQEDALGLLERIPYEDNKTTRLFLGSAFPCGSAYDSQAQLELMDRYCSQKRCLKCAIGEKIVRGMGMRPLNTV